MILGKLFLKLTESDNLLLHTKKRLSLVIHKMVNLDTFLYSDLQIVEADKSPSLEVEPLAVKNQTSILTSNYIHKTRQKKMVLKYIVIIHFVQGVSS